MKRVDWRLAEGNQIESETYMIPQNRTEICVILDRSGSMGAVRDATIEAFNGFLVSQREGTGQASITLVQFDDQYERVYQGIPVREAIELTTRTYVPRGSTALLDAIGRGLLETAERLYGPAGFDSGTTVIFVVQTDGEENASRKFTLQQINAMIADFRDRFGWQFVFLGANQDAIASAGAMGIAPQAAMGYSHTAAGTAGAFDCLNDEIHRVRTNRAAGGNTSFSFRKKS